MVIKALLDGSIKGVGKFHKTSVFPCGIFQVGEGINKHKGDPNYDLFQLALKSTAKRLYPNYVSIDLNMQQDWIKQDRKEKRRVIANLSPGDYKELESIVKDNKELQDFLFLKYDKDKGLIVDDTPHPFEITSTMGCVEGNEVITYKFQNKLYVESFKRMWTRMSDYFEVKEQVVGNSDNLYLDVKDVTIYDTKKGFVNVKRVIRNTSNDWVNVKMSHGRSLICTSDHPFHTDRGRVYASDLRVDDVVSINQSQYCEDKLTFNENKAWLLGFILCDGCYDSHVSSSIALNSENDIQDSYIKRMKECFNSEVKVVERHRGVRGNYKDLFSVGEVKHIIDYLSTKFEGLTKNRRHIPNEVFSWNYTSKLNFLAGMIDADGYINPTTHNGSVVQLGSTNKELALQQMALVQSLNMPCAVYQNHYSKKRPDAIRYKVEFVPSTELLNFIVSQKKINNYVENKTSSCHSTSEVSSVSRINGKIDYSYDVETDSDHFEVSGIYSHNCRTQVGLDIHAKDSYRNNVHTILMGHDTLDGIQSAAQKDGRGNICPVTMILPTFAMQAKEQGGNIVDNFFKILNKNIDKGISFLVERYKWICKQPPESAYFMYHNHTMSGFDEKDIESAIRHGTLGLGQLGLAEALEILIGKNQTDREGLKLAIKIEKLINKKCSDYKKEHKMNIGVYYTPAENLCYTAMTKFKEKYGIIKNVSDKKYFTNSMHIPVNVKIDAFDKINIESQLTGFSNAGCITYVELDSTVSHNIPALEKLVVYAVDHDIPYFAINVPNDTCLNCGYSAEINDKCPKCGSDNIQRLRRVTGLI